MSKNYFIKCIFFVSCFFALKYTDAQVTTEALGTYGLRLINPSYTGNAINVRRTCDGATADIGFSCGALNTTALTDFTTLSGSLSGVTTSAVVAYGLRKLNCTYTGNAINVRRSSDNTTQDIGFTTDGDLDTASLLTFVGTNNGFVTTWYDQSGNARNATQATKANQPMIISAGVTERQNKMPSVFFNNTGASGYTIGLQTANLNVFTTAACFLGVASVKTNLTYNTIVVKTNSNNYPCPFDFYCAGGTTTSLLVGNGTAGDYNSWNTTKEFNAAAGLNIWTYQANGTATNGVNAYYDASTQILANQKATYFGDENTPIYIGARYDGVTGLNGWISEILLFNAIPAAADIGFLNYTEGTYFGISGPTYTAPTSSTNLDAYITTWYDQSGNGNDATQATTADQPLIVSAGVINLQSSLPSINFNGTSQFLTANGFTKAFNNTVGGGGTLNTMAVNNGAASLQGIAQQGRNSTPWWGVWGSSTGKWEGSFSNGPGNMISTTNSSVFEPITLIQLPTTSTTLYGNGASLSTSATTANSSNGKSFYIGYSDNATEYWDGNGSEVNVFGTGLNTTQRTLLETNQGAYYGLTPTNSKYTVANGYNLFVNGIGCATAFTDSVAGTRQSVGMGFIDVSFLGTGNYMTAGTTCPSAGVTTSTYMPAGATAGYERWLNDWLLNYTNPAGTSGSVEIYFDFSDYGVSGIGSPANASNYQLWGRATPTSNFAKVTTSAVAIVGNRVTFTVSVSNLTSGHYYTIGTIDYQNSPLPIDLLNFTAIPDGEKVDIAWQTRTEQNNAYFTIEKSKDGTTFTKLIDVPGAGNSSVERDYAETDYQPYSSTSYYRLKQTDNNGNYKYSYIVTVNFNNAQQNIMLSPNPILSGSTMGLKVTGYQNQEVTVLLRDVQGREFLTTILLTGDIDHTFTVSEVQSLPPGIYIVTASTNDKIYNCKLIVR